MKRSLIPAVLVAILGGLWASQHAIAGTSYDGAWSVLIITDHGTCDRAYRYALRIADGRVYYDDPSFNVSGNVNARGQVHVGVDAGGQSANGYGQLSGQLVFRGQKMQPGLVGRRG